MNILLWILQVLAALLYGASGVMKVFMFDTVSQDVPSFGALPRRAWMTLGMLELVCTVGLIVPAAFRWQPPLTNLAAAVLAVESLVFVGVHVKYREVTPMILSCVLGLVMAFIAYGHGTGADPLTGGPGHRHPGNNPSPASSRRFRLPNFRGSYNIEFDA
jgi:uncharacterized membrane protein YphA (DoxX/SURF4 family)